MSSTSTEATDLASLQRQFGRQALRAPLVAEWFLAAGLQSGSAIADLGCGPGYVSLRAAEYVGERGGVYAVDSNTEAIAMLRDIASLHRLHQIHTFDTTIEALDALPGPVDAALLGMVLHHVDAPETLLTHLRRLLPEEACLVIAEFTPDGPGHIGPALGIRLGPARLREFAATAGFDIEHVERQSSEHWFCVLRPS